MFRVTVTPVNLPYNHVSSERGIYVRWQDRTSGTSHPFRDRHVISGPSKLAGLGKGLGEGIRGFKSALDDRDSTAKKD